MEVLGVIPARANSKGIPGKNFKLLNGKPLIGYTIEEGLKSQINRLIVSTDSSEIAKISKDFGAEVPFLRPSELSQDDSVIKDSILQVLKKLKEAGLYLGLTFQIVDDILDNTGTTSLLGKPAGSDANNNKSTYISLLGKEKAQETAQKFYEHTLSLLRSLPGDSKPLEEVMDFILKRNN